MENTVGMNHPLGKEVDLPFRKIRINAGNDLIIDPSWNSLVSPSVPDFKLAFPTDTQYLIPMESILSLVSSIEGRSVKKVEFPVLIEHSSPDHVIPLRNLDKLKYVVVYGAHWYCYENWELQEISNLSEIVSITDEKFLAPSESLVWGITDMDNDLHTVYLDAYDAGLARKRGLYAVEAYLLSRRI
jgi:hypothetical protein